MSSAVPQEASEPRVVPVDADVAKHETATTDDAESRARNIAAAVERADAARDSRQWQSAAKGYRAVLDLDPERAPIWVQYGHMLKESGDPVAAEDAYEQALKLDPENADTHLQLGHVRKIAGRKHSAVQSYLRSLELDPSLRDPWKELCALGMKSRADRIIESAETNEKATCYFDLSDIMIHFADNRTPTGIQRIVLAVSEAALRDDDAEEVALCTVDTETGKWKRINSETFLHLMELSHEGARTSEPEWQSAVGDLVRMIAAAPPLKFPEGSTIISLGSPWGFQNYFMALREAKRESGVSYVAFVHDTVPLLYPEYCEGVIPIEYARWLHNLLSHADLVLANAENTKRDFLNAISKFGSGTVDCEFVYPNGDFSSMFESSGQASVEVQSIASTKYALFVGTIQPRKNHLMILSAWRQLMKELPPDSVPTLVLAGKLGWHWEQVLEFARKTENLDGKLRMLNQVSDTDLQTLYQNAMFTIYNSHYEGWGLPVTESLSFGKVPVVARNSALLESGGRHAIFFESGSEPSFMDAVRKLILEPDTIAEHERAILADPPVRSWLDVSREIRRIVKASRDKAKISKAKPRSVENKPKLAACYHFGMRKFWSTEKRDGFYNAQAFADFELTEVVRAGPDWQLPEEWGVWTRRRTFKLVFDLSVIRGEKAWREDDELRLLLHVRGHYEPAKLRFDMNDLSNQTFVVQPHTEPVLCMNFRPAALSGDTLILMGSQNSLTDLRRHNDGRDPRTIGIALRSFMLCRPDDLDARLKYLEELSGYLEGTVGASTGGAGLIASLDETDGGFLRLGGQRADVAHANR